MKKIKNLSKIFILLTQIVFLFTGCQPSGETATNYQYYTQEELKASIENKSPVMILDIQVEEDFEAHHIEGALATYAFPVKSDEDKAKLDASLPLVEETSNQVVIVCPMGKVGAERTYDYLIEKGIPSERLFILEGGQSAWVSESDATDTERPASETSDTSKSDESEGG